VANRAIADAVCQEIDREATAPIVMLQDYQLYLAPGIIRQRRPTVVMQQFIHIPWPEVRYWLFLPSTIVQAIYRGLMGNDIVGFQTERDARNFLEGAGTMLEGAVVDSEAGAVCWRGRRTQVRTYPISISITEERRTVRSADGKRAAEQIRPLLGKYTIMRVDRIDPAKNIIRGFQAYELMLEAHPELHREVTFLAFLVPSRKTVPLYRRYGAKVLDVIEQINRKFGKGEWTPIQAFCGNDRTRALAAMQWYDVLLVNPLMDGMNLVAKEGPVVNQRNGVLVLSRNAGAYQELARGAIAISPLDLIETADGLYRGLTMSPEEREQKATLVRLAVENNDLNAWFTRQLSDLDALVERGHVAPLPLKKPTAIESAEKVATRVS
jgi:trehalose 6-phosphate synthase